MICITKEEADLFKAAIAYEEAWTDSRLPRPNNNMFDAIALEGIDWHVSNCKDDLVLAAVRYARSLIKPNFEANKTQTCD